VSADNYHRITEGADGHWWLTHGFASDDDRESETLLGIYNSLEEATKAAQADGYTEYGLSVDFLEPHKADEK
jgi:hypothetical protein